MESKWIKRVVLLALLGLLLIFSFLLRIMYIENTKIIAPIRADARSYVVLALNLAEHHVYSSAKFPAYSDTAEQWPPGFPLLMSFIYSASKSFGGFYWTTLLIQSFLGALTALLSFYLARRMLPDPWAFLLACAVSVSPFMVVISAYLLTETLFTFLLILSLLLLIMAREQDSFVLHALAGLAMGLCILTRPAIAAFPVIWFAAFALYDHGGNLRRSVLCGLLFIVLSFSFQTGWSLWRRSLVASPSSDQIKKLVLLGSYPDLIFKDAQMRGYPYLEDPSFNKYLRSYPSVISHIESDFRLEPMRYFLWYLRKPLYLWSGNDLSLDGLNFYPVSKSWFDTNPAMGALKKTFQSIQPYLFLVAFLGGGVLFFYPGKSRSMPDKVYAFKVCFVLLFEYTLMFIVLAPVPRYAIPLVPVMYLLALFVIYNSLKPLKKRLSWKPFSS